MAHLEFKLLGKQNIQQQLESTCRRNIKELTIKENSVVFADPGLIRIVIKASLSSVSFSSFDCLPSYTLKAFTTLKVTVS